MTVISTRIGTLTNLPTSGTYDLLTIKFPDGFPESQLIFDIDDTPRKVTGIQKVAQMFLKILLTSRGSNVLYPSQGTAFPQLAVGANILTDDPTFVADLSEQIRAAESQVKGIFNTSGSDVASQLDAITILGIDVLDEGAVLYLRILTKAGAKAQIAVPFPQTDMKISADS